MENLYRTTAYLIYTIPFSSDGKERIAGSPSATLRLVGGEQKEMNTTQKSQRTFMTVTMITVVAVSTVFIVYAAVLLTLTGTTVTVTEGGGLVEYSLDGSTWSTTLSPMINGTDWYARITITGASVQDVIIDWTLQVDTPPWTDTGSPTQTTMTLAAGSNTIYATADGLATGNRNWGLDTTSGGSYRVEATVNG